MPKGHAGNYSRSLEIIDGNFAPLLEPERNMTGQSRVEWLQGTDSGSRELASLENPKKQLGR